MFQLHFIQIYIEIAIIIDDYKQNNVTLQAHVVERVCKLQHSTLKHEMTIFLPQKHATNSTLIKMY